MTGKSTRKDLEQRIQLLEEELISYRQAEKSIPESKINFKSFAEEALVGRYFIQDGVFKYVNPRFARMFGYTVEECLNNVPFESLIHEEGRANVTEQIRKRIAGESESVHYQIRGRKKHGQIFDAEIYESSIIQEGGPAVTGTILDIAERTKSEKALQASEEKYRTLFDSAGDAIFIHDLNGQILAANTTACAQYGYTPSEFLTMQVNMVDVVEQSAHVPTRILRVRTQGIAQFETAHRHKDGKMISVEVKAQQITWDHQPVIMSICRDITERKHAEEALRKNEAILSGITKNMPAVIYQFYAKDNGEYGASYGGDRLQEIFGITGPMEDLFPAFASCIHQEDYKRFQSSVQKAVETVTPCDFEGRFIKPSGEMIWFHGLSTPTPLKDRVVFDAILLDITDRKLSEEQVHLAEDKFSNIFMTTPDCIVISRILDGKVIDVNPGFEVACGWSREEVLGRRTIDLNVWANAEDRNQMVKDLLEGRDILSRETTFRRKEGTIHNAIYSARPISIAGEPCLIFVLQDITELRRVEEDRRRLELQLIQSQKMEAIGTLAGGIAHDFNNMLGIILGHAEIALMNVESSQRLYKNLEEIRKAAERSADLTRQLLAFARKQTVAPKVLDLNETVEGMLKMLRRLIGEDIELAWLPGNRLWRVKMDPSQIDQILVNLCVNARDAITGVGKITIETETAVFDKDYLPHHTGAFPGEFILIAVNDSGSGMDKNILGKLFEPFFTTKALGKGTGLGLATVYGIVKQNNGFIDVYSEAGQGSTFKIYLPRHADETEQARQDNKEASVARGKGTILLVEDEPALLNMTAKMLEHLGYTVLSAGTPGEAAHIAENQAGDIHLFMTDVIMPGMNGRDLAKNILSLYTNIRLLFMSGYTADIIAHQGVLNEGVHFIQKPFSLSRLADKVREVME